MQDLPTGGEDDADGGGEPFRGIVIATVLGAVVWFVFFWRMQC